MRTYISICYKPFYVHTYYNPYDDAYHNINATIDGGPFNYF